MVKHPRTLLKDWDLHAKKQLGQNFLKDPSTARMILDRAGLSGDDVVVEIGAGLGALTVPLSSIVKKVYAVEKDRSIVPLLQSVLAQNTAGTTEILACDILDVDLGQIATAADDRIVVVGNLPYNISSQILVKLIRERDWIDRCVLMFQRELVGRLLAAPGRKDYGRLSVMLQYCADIKKIAEVKAALFLPKPKVDSDVVEIKFKTAPEFVATDEAYLFRVIKSAFSKRRKMLRNSIDAKNLGVDSDTMGKVFDQTGIDPSRRAETLSVEEFVRLSNVLYKELAA